MKKLKIHQSGFTLLEILVSIAIVGIAVTIVFQLFSANLRAISVSEDYASAIARAEEKMREILDDEKLSDKSWSETTEDGYRIDYSISKVLEEKTENLQVEAFQIDLSIHWTTGMKNRSMKLSTIKTVEKQV
jgi:prepilin-type N-terminal cleavage/methylation domain-containing protein